ncbi:MAG: DUF4374 domain-containing protein [Bacteroidales bacterium]|jgi:hypothetical protein|nr:DUF4374 domain-containing protein [Bacteroidales bacterium]
MNTKKSFLNKVILTGVIGCLSLSLISCDKDEKETKEIPVTGVSLDRSDLTLSINETEQLLATITPENATNKKWTWSSSNTSIATVTENGLVTGVAAGEATITVTTESGGFTANCATTVQGTVVDPEPPGTFFLSVNGETAAYIMLTDNLVSGELQISDNVKTLEQTGHSWFFNENPSVAVGLIYQQGDPGIGLGISLTKNLTLNEPANFQISSRHTSYGYFDKYALATVGGLTIAGTERSDGVTVNFIDVTNNFAMEEKTIPTLNITGNGEQATFSGIVDMGNGEFLTGLVVSQPKDPNAGGGASSGTITYPDSCWVAAFDKDLKLKRIYRSGKLSYSSGRMRSQYYSQIGKAADGSVYVFSGSYESTTTKPCGALKIDKNATAFNSSYYFNIEELTEGYHFRKVWHVADNYFMLEIYNTVETGATAAATQYGIVDVAAKTFKWITGIPSKEAISGTGLPMGYKGKMYFPIAETGVDPAVYIIDPATAAATKGLSIRGAASLNAIGRLSYIE